MGIGIDTAERVLIHDADVLITMDAEQRVLEHASVSLDGNEIEEVGEIDPSGFDRVIDARGQVVIPGLINTHHHMSQGLLKGYPDIQNQPIDKWVDRVARVVRTMDPEMILDAAMLNMAELALYGCTTSTDMSYLTFDGEDMITPTVLAAREVGMRFETFAGGLTQSEKDGAIFPDDAAEDSDELVGRLEDLIRDYHDARPLSMLRVGLGLCSFFTNSYQDFVNVLDLSQRHGVNLQTHVSESDAENRFVSERFGRGPVNFLRTIGWAGARVSYVHCINVDPSDISTLASTGTSVSHCPISNARSPEGQIGLAPVAEMLRAGVNVALGTDGSAGNDSSNLREELRWSRTMQGVARETTYLSPEDSLRMGTINGARLLNRQGEIGSLAPGKAADLAMFELNSVEMAGSWDALCGLLATHGVRASLVMINGRIVVEGSRLKTIDEQELVGRVGEHMRALKEKVEVMS